jgi:hypothetical protein
MTQQIVADQGNRLVDMALNFSPEVAVAAIKQGIIEGREDPLALKANMKLFGDFIKMCGEDAYIRDAIETKAIKMKGEGYLGFTFKIVNKKAWNFNVCEDPYHAEQTKILAEAKENIKKREALLMAADAPFMDEKSEGIEVMPASSSQRTEIHCSKIKQKV